MLSTSHDLNGNVSQSYSDYGSQAVFYKIPNTLKSKVGDGGLSRAHLIQAEKLFNHHAINFKPVARTNLEELRQAIALLQHPDKQELSPSILDKIIRPATNLRANGAMFHYPSITKIADKFLTFFYLAKKMDDDFIEITQAFYKITKTVLDNDIKDSGENRVQELLRSMNDAFMRYFNKHPEIGHAQAC